MRKAGFWALAAVCGVLLLVVFSLLAPGTPRRVERYVAYSDVLTEAAAGHLVEVTLQGHFLIGRMADGRIVQSYLPDDPGLASRLAGQGVRVLAQPEEEGNLVLRTLIAWVPSLLFLGVWVASLRRMAHEVRALRRTLDGIAVRLPGGAEQP